jgi:hypothetical protein
MSRNTAELRTCGPKEEVRVWHRTDMPAVLSDVRCWGQSGKHLLAVRISHIDP